uniref:Uncharacterized protein n=1 Tax=Aegilops tauschii subsp. strangulata TaxID=200361 RepID=A0A452Y4K2_AEGTS
MQQFLQSGRTGVRRKSIVCIAISIPKSPLYRFIFKPPVRHGSSSRPSTVSLHCSTLSCLP